MNTRFSGLPTATLLVAAFIGVAACGGGSDDNGGPAPGGPNAPPVPVITSPAEGATYKAGDTLTFAGQWYDHCDRKGGGSHE